ncbi:MAG: cupin domain-containing protein [Chromatiales bacterium]
MGKRGQQPDIEAFDNVVFTAWAEALSPLQPHPSLRQRVLARARADSLVRTVRAEDGWVELLPGVQIKMLYRDTAGGTKSFLARLQPGTMLPAHEHGLVEECYVIEGEIIMGDIVIRAGDYHLAMKGARHEATTTSKGAVLYMRAALTQHIPEAASS